VQSQIIGILIGIPTGAVQFFLLYKFVTSVTGGKFGSKTIIFALTQILFPFTVLVAVAFLLPDGLMWAGISMGAALICSAIVRFVMTSRTKNK